MSEQWFLDLDGVRSGPYQTSEVMSLVAEGEILPHHQIATDLKSQKWMTILEWRLNQNRTADPHKEAIALATSTFSPIQEKPTETKITPIIEKEPVKVVVPPAPAAMSTPPSSSASADPTKPKRDPMAEMFDMLQNTKQKREVKSQQSHAHAHAHAQTTTHPPAGSAQSNPKAKQQGNWGKTIIIGLVITVIGFALGQFFQHQKPTETTSTTANTASPVSAKPVTGTPEENKIETVDRSTDKMTIRAQVPTDSNASASPTPEHVKDIQELKDLKKELLELKALKEEIRGNNDPGHINNAVPRDDKNIDNYDIDPGSEGGALDENGNPIKAPTAEDDTHY